MAIEANLLRRGLEKLGTKPFEREFGVTGNQGQSALIVDTEFTNKEMKILDSTLPTVKSKTGDEYYLSQPGTLHLGTHVYAWGIYIKRLSQNFEHYGGAAYTVVYQEPHRERKFDMRFMLDPVHRDAQGNLRAVCVVWLPYDYAPEDAVLEPILERLLVHAEGRHTGQYRWPTEQGHPINRPLIKGKTPNFDVRASELLDDRSAVTRLAKIDKLAERSVGAAIPMATPCPECAAVTSRLNRPALVAAVLAVARKQMPIGARKRPREEDLEDESPDAKRIRLATEALMDRLEEQEGFERLQWVSRQTTPNRLDPGRELALNPPWQASQLTVESVSILEDAIVQSFSDPPYDEMADMALLNFWRDLYIWVFNRDIRPNPATTGSADTKEGWHQAFFDAYDRRGYPFLIPGFVELDGRWRKDPWKTQPLTYLQEVALSYGIRAKLSHNIYLLRRRPIIIDDKGQVYTLKRPKRDAEGKSTYMNTRRNEKRGKIKDVILPFHSNEMWVPVANLENPPPMVLNSMEVEGSNTSEVRVQLDDDTVQKDEDLFVTEVIENQSQLTFFELHSSRDGSLGWFNWDVQFIQTVEWSPELLPYYADTGGHVFFKDVQTEQLMKAKLDLRGYELVMHATAAPARFREIRPYTTHGIRYMKDDRVIEGDGRTVHEIGPFGSKTWQVPEEVPPIVRLLKISGVHQDFLAITETGELYVWSRENDFRPLVGRIPFGYNLDFTWRMGDIGSRQRDEMYKSNKPLNQVEPYENHGFTTQALPAATRFVDFFTVNNDSMVLVDENGELWGLGPELLHASAQLHDRGLIVWENKKNDTETRVYLQDEAGKRVTYATLGSFVEFVNRPYLLRLPKVHHTRMMRLLLTSSLTYHEKIQYSIGLTW